MALSEEKLISVSLEKCVDDAKGTQSLQAHCIGDDGGNIGEEESFYGFFGAIKI